MTGYQHPHYALSFSEFGDPLELPNSGGWVLERPLTGFGARDVMGCYPLFSCRNWSALSRDMQWLGSDFVSISLVTDPFGDFCIKELQRIFEDKMIPFKEHFISDLTHPIQEIVGSSHRRNARKALRQVSVEVCPHPPEFLEEWTRLYQTLIQRHHIKGIAAFSRGAFRIQLQVPGIRAFRASLDGKTVGMLLWYVQGEVAYYHLGAFDSTGYRLGASFALFWFAMQYFKQSGVRWLDIGAVPGVNQDASSGLRRFKRGWATGTRPAYFCGLTLDPAKYEKIVREKCIGATDYFPAYRWGEFA